MLTSIILIILGFIWLGIESKWLTIRLPANETLTEYDCRILSQIKTEWESKESRYQEWLAKRYESKLVLCPQQDKECINPRDNWMVIEDDLQSRRRGEMIYQRGSHYGQ